MTKQEIIEKWKLELVDLEGKAGKCLDNEDDQQYDLYSMEAKQVRCKIADVKKLNVEAVSKEVFIDFMEWMRKYNFIDEVNIDDIIVDEYLKSIKQRSGINT